MKTPEQMLEALGQPFPRTAIKTRPGGGGKALSYVETHTVIHRLNSATNGDWTWIPKSAEWRADLLIVMGELTIPGLGTRGAYGVQKVSDRGGEDLVKGANSDALKKAATMFGVGLELYGADYESFLPKPSSDPTDDPQFMAAAQAAPRQRAPQAPQRHQDALKPANTTPSQGTTITSAQGVVVAQARHVDATAPKDMRSEALGRTLHGLAEHDFLHALAVKWGFTSFADVPAENRQLALDYLNGRGDPAKLQAFHTFRRQWEEQEKRASLKAQANELLPGLDEIPNPTRFTQ